MAQVHDNDVLASVDFSLQLLRSDPCDPQPPQESLALIEFPSDVGCERAKEQDKQPSSEVSRFRSNEFQVATEHVTGRRESGRPKQRPSQIEEQKPPPSHLYDAAQRSGHRVQARNEFCDQEDARSVASK